MGANDSWMNRVVPAASAASTRFAEPVRRTRSFSRQAPGISMRALEAGMWVARLITTS